MAYRGPFNWLTRASWDEQARRELDKVRIARAQGIARLMASLNSALRSGDATAIAQCQEALERFLDTTKVTPGLLNQLRSLLDQQRAEPLPSADGASRIAIYWISSTTLAEAYAYLTQHLPDTAEEPEWMLAVTGLRRGHIHTLEHLIEVKLKHQSPARASFDTQDFTRIAVRLYEHGQALHAIFHSHRFLGPPHPSGTDDRLQQTLEEGGYPAIQAVFSEDGYVRFFARRRRFAVEIYGKGVTCIDRERNLYRIVQFSTLPHPTHPARTRQRDGLRSLPARARG